MRLCLRCSSCMPESTCTVHQSAPVMVMDGLLVAHDSVRHMPYRDAPSPSSMIAFFVRLAGADAPFSC